jgi:hypothetical protein
MLIKVYGGTPVQQNESLCWTCRHARVVRGHALDEEVVFCDAMTMRPVRITFMVSSCSDYDDGRLPSYYQLLEQAWILRPASCKRPAGFVRASELGDEEIQRFMERNRRHE